MLFNSFIFLFSFLPVTYVVYWLLRTPRSRYVWLSVTGYVFYGWWDWRFCLLMAFSTVVSYSAGLGMLRWADDPRRRRLCLVVPVTVDLLLLGFFKYANFGLATVHDGLRLAGLDIRVPHLDVVLPVGISFYTFHTISYIVDAYRGQIRPTRNFFEFSAYVSLFSQLVAGPIVRFRQIEEDLEALGTASRTRWLWRGAAIFVVGLFEKVVLADALAAVADPAFNGWQALSTSAMWVGVGAYTLQLYFDFSGYSTMAVGLGLLFGLRIPRNFASPYQALDPSDFWRRWHISLSTCMRDYLYIPLGGNRGTGWETFRNLMLTMLIGGLWHGASWNFVLWGGYHGLLLAAYRAAARWWDPLPARLRQAGTLLLVMIGWVPFRAPDLRATAGIVGRLFGAAGGTAALPDVSAALLLPLFAVTGGLALAAPHALDLDYDRGGWQFRVAVALAFGAALAVIAGGQPSPFLYFQF